MNERPTVLFQPPNHVGLGHINRLSAIAIALKEIQESVRSVFIVEGAGHALLDVLNLPSLPLPSDHAMFETESWNRWSSEKRSSLSQEISRAILRNIRPQVVVFDCFPNPAFARAVLEEGIPTVLCLRWMRDMKKYLNYIHDLLDQIAHIIIPHEPGAFEVPQAIKTKSCFIGRIVRPFKQKTKALVNHPNRQVVIIGGGGGYPGTVVFYNLAIKALVELRQIDSTVTGRLITGPLFQDWAKLELEAGISLTPFEPDTLGTFSMADLVISAAGYNVTAELVEVGTKTIVIPAERLWDDQFERAERLVRAHSHFRLFTGASSHDLARIMGDVLQDTPTIPIGMSSNGACRAAELLCRMLEGS
jgi:predicted glycosyltransferase